MEISFENDHKLFIAWGLVEAALAKRMGAGHSDFTLKKRLYEMARQERFEFSDEEMEQIANIVISAVGVVEHYTKTG
tara:strand:- start:791 stop:1021 length:231 start_codon:yes stop_codon:yes gene_type:complete